MGLGGYAVGVYGAAWGYRRDMAPPSLMADMYGFACEEEMARCQRVPPADMVDTRLNR